MQRRVKRAFENNSLIKNTKNFWVLPFLKRRRLSKLFGKSFTKNLYDFRMLLRLTFQTVSNNPRDYSVPGKDFLETSHGQLLCGKSIARDFYLFQKAI
ncbi:hypothetical protein BGC30_10625 [Novacetimonas hansenii]|nr:hypothetical protein BGC30_10625 [Novacetimonas hansenii]